MEAVGQTAALRELFSAVYRTVRPTRLAVLGCTTGADFEEIDAAVTDVSVGVDINAGYLDAAAQRLAALGRRVHLVCGDVLDVNLALAPFDLVYAALLLEYVNPISLFRRAHQWLSPEGYFSVVTQEPVAGLAAVSGSRYEILQSLSGTMILRSAKEIAVLGSREGFYLQSRRVLELPTRKTLTLQIFQTAPPPNRYMVSKVKRAHPGRD